MHKEGVTLMVMQCMAMEMAGLRIGMQRVGMEAGLRNPIKATWLRILFCLNQVLTLLRNA